MKKIIFAAALLIGSLSTRVANAQIGIRLNLNIGSQPDWGPVGYDHVDYYYLPDVDAYYDVPTHQYVYLENNIWVHRAYLPVRYRGYDLYHGYKVVVNQPNPWLRHTYYRTTYARYRGRPGQTIIRDSRDSRYRDHWRGDRGPGGRPGPGRPGPGPGDHGHGPGGDHGHGGGHGPGGDHGHDGGHGPGGDHGHGGGDHGHGGEHGHH